MSAKPATGAGHVPMMRYSLQTPTPADFGGLARNTVLPPGSAGQTSFTAITPAVLVMTRSCGASSGNSGGGGGVFTGSRPKRASLQLTRTNRCSPVSGPLWPCRGCDRYVAAAAFQASRCASVSSPKRRACSAKFRRTSVWRSVRGLSAPPPPSASPQLPSPHRPRQRSCAPRLSMAASPAEPLFCYDPYASDYPAKSVSTAVPLEVPFSHTGRTSHSPLNELPPSPMNAFHFLPGPTLSDRIIPLNLFQLQSPSRLLSATRAEILIRLSMNCHHHR